jgi:hypothetical protein
VSTSALRELGKPLLDDNILRPAFPLSRHASAVVSVSAPEMRADIFAPLPYSTSAAAAYVADPGRRNQAEPLHIPIRLQNGQYELQPAELGAVDRLEAMETR